MRGILGGPLQCGHHHRLDLLVGHRARPSRARLVDQPIQPAFHKQPRPHAHRLRPNPDFAGDLLVGFSCRTTQHNPTPLRQRLRRRRPAPASSR